MQDNDIIDEIRKQNQLNYLATPKTQPWASGEPILKIHDGESTRVHSFLHQKPMADEMNRAYASGRNGAWAEMVRFAKEKLGVER